jgi:hypothetical protein
MTDSIFVLDGERFVPTEKARSPWSETQLHGGSAAGLLARAVERFNDDPALQVARLTVDLLKPVPNAPLQAHTSSVRRGNRIHVVEAVLTCEGELVTRATALLMRRLDQEVAVQPPPAVLTPPDGLESSNLGGWMRPPGAPPSPPLLAQQGLHTTIEVRWLNRGDHGGQNGAWVRLPVPFIEGEENTPLVRAAAVSDFTNALSNMAAPSRGSGRAGPVSFINADITLYLHRYPRGEWIALETGRSAQPSGIGVSTAAMHDVDGPIGTVVEAILANQRR